MLFNSIDFLLFFPIVAFLYFIIPKKAKTYWLLLCSYYFYMCWNAKYALLILTSTVITYLSGIGLEKVKNMKFDEKKSAKYKKLIVAGSFISNLAILFFFKYFNFAMNLLGKALGFAHIQLSLPVFDVMLPVGISFYTFQALSYTMDVYRDDIYAEKNFFRYALFVSFFPQLVAGPIERSKNLLKQLAVPKKFNYDEAKDGFLLMLWGFFLKIVVADRVAIFVDTVYNNYQDYPGMYLIVATVLFAVQIYCDFSGYSTIAMGAAKIMGFNLMENFNAPYLATSVAGFWRNWHISLTSWFKDYLYIPLGGSRKGKFRKYMNKLIVFLVSGLWHGASLSFVAWGGLNGIYQIIGEVLQPVRDKAVKILNLNRDSIGHKLAHILGTFILIDFSWIFFRASRFIEALAIIKSMIFTYNPWILFDDSLYKCGLSAKNFRLMLFCIAILIFVDICKHKGIKIREIILKQDYWVKWIAIPIMIAFLLLFGKYGPAYDAANFIYFQF
ncbi:MAG: MBOAT family O-acyltransferase [Clostridia bacterium]|nr:MBOAT family O-acyltransferase [Clostridia bacterium]